MIIITAVLCKNLQIIIVSHTHDIHCNLYQIDHRNLYQFDHL